MKKHYAIATAFFICIFNFTTITAWGVNSDGPGNHHNFNNITFSPNFSNNVSVSTFQEMTASINSTIKVMCDAAGKAYEKSAESLSNLKEWASNNKLKVALYTTASVYGYVTYKLFTLKHVLAQPENWSLWNHSTSLEELYALSEKELGEILVKEAQQRYTIVNDPENFITPLVTFLQMVEEEKKLLQAYISLYEWIQSLRLEKILWVDAQLAAACQERLKRLAYLRAIFVNWITEYKFMHNAVPPCTAPAHAVPAAA
jgi:hypothetical protein